MQTLKFIGTGSAFNINRGNTSAYLRSSDELFLIDCGEDVFQKIIYRNLLDNVKNVYVIITHLHTDHVGSLSSFIFYCHYVKNIMPKVYYPDVKLSDILTMSDTRHGIHYYCLPLKINKANDIESSQVIAVEPVIVKHSPRLKCYGYILYLTDKTIYFSGDCSEIEPSILTSDIDEIYHDSCLLEMDNNVHCSLSKLLKVDLSLRNKFYCMHIDNEALVQKLKNSGFNIAK